MRLCEFAGMRARVCVRVCACLCLCECVRACVCVFDRSTMRLAHDRHFHLVFQISMPVLGLRFWSSGDAGGCGLQAACMFSDRDECKV